MKTKVKASDKRLIAFTNEVQTKILHPNYENRVTLAEIFDDLKPCKLITGRRCIGSKKVLNKITDKVESKPKYKITKRFIEFEDKTKLSVSTVIFSHFKIDHKLPHKFENYYA